MEGAEAVLAQWEGPWDELVVSVPAPSECGCARAWVYACPWVCMCACVYAGGGLAVSELVNLYPPPLCPLANGGSTLVDRRSGTGSKWQSQTQTPNIYRGVKGSLNSLSWPLGQEESLFREAEAGPRGGRGETCLCQHPEVRTRVKDVGQGYWGCAADSCGGPVHTNAWKQRLKCSRAFFTLVFSLFSKLPTGTTPPARQSAYILLMDPKAQEALCRPVRK